MKKYVSICLLFFMAAFTFVACDEDEDNLELSHISIHHTGVYLIGEGNEGAKLPGMLTSIDKTNWSAVENAFSRVNGRTLGMTANGGTIYGSKLYIVMFDENRIEVVDKHTLRSVKVIDTKQLAGDVKGNRPRQIVGANGCVYITTQGSSVLAIDTVNFALNNIYAVGKYPEGLTATSHYIYVANSDYGNKEASLSIINLDSKKVTNKTDELIYNPQKVVCVGNDVYVLAWGKYDTNWNQPDAGVLKISNGKIKKIASGTMMAVKPTGKDNALIYVCNAAYGKAGKDVAYSVYNTQNQTTKTINMQEKVEWPVAMAVDPHTGYLYVTSDPTDPVHGGAIFAGLGYLNVYQPNGTLIKRHIPAGTHSSTILFD